MFSTLAFYDDDNDGNDGSQTELIINKANARVISIHWSNDSDRQTPLLFPKSTCFFISILSSFAFVKAF